MTRQATKYNTIIGILKDKTVVVLEETFKYDEDFHGATGYIMGTKSRKEVEQENSIEYIASEYEYLWKEAVEAGKTQLGLYDWCEKIKEDAKEDHLLSPFDDPSFRNDFEKALAKILPPSEDAKALLETFGSEGKDFEAWDCWSCGRCIPIDNEDYLYIFNPQLLEEVRKAEA